MSLILLYICHLTDGSHLRWHQTVDLLNIYYDGAVGAVRMSVDLQLFFSVVYLVDLRLIFVIGASWCCQVLLVPVIRPQCGACVCRLWVVGLSGLAALISDERALEVC